MLQPPLESLTGIPEISIGDYLYFDDSPEAKIGDYAVFSDLHHATFIDNSRPENEVNQSQYSTLHEPFIFTSLKHFMAYHKALLFNDQDAAEKILVCKTPSEIPEIEKEIRDFNEEIWKQYAQEIAYHGCLFKFAQNSKLKQILVSTGDKVLVKADANDSLWGIGLGLDDVNRDKRAFQDQRNWKGDNWLGGVLMRVRDTLSRG